MTQIALDKKPIACYNITIRYSTFISLIMGFESTEEEVLGAGAEVVLSAQELAQRACDIFKEQLSRLKLCLVESHDYRGRVYTVPPGYTRLVIRKADVYVVARVTKIKPKVERDEPVVELTLERRFDLEFAVREEDDDLFKSGCLVAKWGKKILIFSPNMIVADYIQDLPILPDVIEVDGENPCNVRVEYILE